MQFIKTFILSDLRKIFSSLPWNFKNFLLKYNKNINFLRDPNRLALEELSQDTMILLEIGTILPLEESLKDAIITSNAEIVKLSESIKKHQLNIVKYSNHLEFISSGKSLEEFYELLLES